MDVDGCMDVVARGSELVLHGCGLCDLCKLVN